MDKESIFNQLSRQKMEDEREDSKVLVQKINLNLRTKAKDDLIGIVNHSLYIRNGSST